MNEGYGIDAVETGDGVLVRGYRCTAGCLTSASYLARCPECGAAAVATSFRGEGTVWSATVLRIPNGDFPADRTIAYVDLDDGPRVLCETHEPPEIGSRVRITGLGLAGTPVVRAA